jgi:hypothetical protein
MTETNDLNLVKSERIECELYVGNSERVYILVRLLYCETIVVLLEQTTHSAYLEDVRLNL